MKITVERDSIINMAVELIREELAFEFMPNKVIGGVVVSGTFTVEDVPEVRAAQQRVAEMRRKRGQL